MTQHDFVISDAPGQPIRLDLQDALQALVSLNAGTTAPGVTPGTVAYPGMLWLDTTVLPNGQLKQRNQANTAWVNIVGFPGKASSADVIAGTDDTKFVTPKGVADRKAVLAQMYRNRVTNPAMQISQEWGSAVLSAGSGFYCADEWRVIFSGGTWSYSQNPITTPKGSRFRIRVTNTAAVGAAAGNFLSFYQVIEGSKIADFLWGTAAAKRVVLRFGFKGAAGTYSFALRNGPAPSRSYVKNFTISAGQANTDVELSFVIPGDTTGTWVTDTGVGLLLTVSPMAGSSFAGTDGVWQAGNLIGTTANANSALLGAVYDLFDVGLYLDALGTGVPPLWEMPEESDEMLRCYRYYCASHYTQADQTCANGSAYYAMSQAPTEMRGNPSIAGQSVSFQSTPNAFGATTYYQPRIVREGRTANAAGVIYFESTVQLSARLA